MEASEPLWRRMWATLTAAQRQALLVALALVTLLAFSLIARFTRDVPVAYSSVQDHFKYGSTGGERSSGIPLALWKTLPRLFPEKLPQKPHAPGREYEVFGFLYETGKDLPIGVSMRDVAGLPRVFLNCAICHVGAVRFEGGPRQLVPGMPSNTVDLEAFQRFLFDSAADEKFNSDRVLAEVGAVAPVDPINRAALRYYGVFFMRQRLLMLGQRFRYLDWEPDFGPGRVDTFTPAKVLENFPLDKIPKEEFGGMADFPSIWLQRKRRNMALHWDGNNSRMEERDRNAAFGTGAFPATLDRVSLVRTEDWLLDLEPPRFPAERIVGDLAARGKPLYEKYCADCHGRDGRDFSGSAVGQVTPIAEIGTDRRRLDSYTFELSVVQNSLYAGYGDERFSHFRKTFGYANLPLDGVWLRAPYLHNGSVPTLRDLLEPSAKRPTVFFRGYDLYDPERMGFVSEAQHFDKDGRSTLDPSDLRRYFRYVVRCEGTPSKPDGCAVRCDATAQGQPLCGNGNAGHEGRAYGTELSAPEKDALLEYLKAF